MNILLFGATGMVGDGLLRWLIASTRVALLPSRANHFQCNIRRWNRRRSGHAPRSVCRRALELRCLPFLSRLMRLFMFGPRTRSGLETFDNVEDRTRWLESHAGLYRRNRDPKSASPIAP